MTNQEPLWLDEMTSWVRHKLTAVADPVAAVPMAAYMKTDMPFYGVKKPQRRRIFTELRKTFPATTRQAYRQGVLALWQQPHREEKYLAIAYARYFNTYVTSDNFDLYRQLIAEGAWWDLVDEVAVHLAGRVWLQERSNIDPHMDQWIDDSDMWIRRSAIIGQLTHKAATDADRLFQYCSARAAEKEFFIRKAIGWALREYTKTDPDAVVRFVTQHDEMLSGLSKREALRNVT